MECANPDGYLWNNSTTPSSKNGRRELNAFHVIGTVLGNSQSFSPAPPTTINSMGKGPFYSTLHVRGVRYTQEKYLPQVPWLQRLSQLSM